MACLLLAVIRAMIFHYFLSTLGLFLGYLQNGEGFVFLPRNLQQSPILSVLDQRPLMRYLEFRKQLDELWERYTLDDSSPPSFFSPSFNSTIVGKEMETVNNRTIYAFQGFLYGFAADNNTRFKPPIPVRKFWEGDTFRADNIGPKCPQGIMVGMYTITSGDEDCLSLNIYTPYLPSEKKKLPVMLYIHGGAFTSGDASLYLPTKLLDHDVVLVTIQYRLGVLGFLSMNDINAPGNPALYDMVQALKWTQEYIEDFGGDKNKVTLFGTSAGAAAVNYMMIIPSARGLFHGAISLSGSALNAWALDENPREAAAEIADYLGCAVEDDQLLFDCLLQAEASELVKAGTTLMRKDRAMGLLGFRGASPTIQTLNLSSEDKLELLVTRHPEELLKKRKFAKVPFMTGSTKHEGSFVLGAFYSLYLAYNDLLEDSSYLRDQLVYEILKAFDSSLATPDLARALTLKYCPGIDLADFKAAAPCLIDMLGAMFFKAATWEISNLYSCSTNQSSFYYSFDFESNNTLYYWFYGDAPFKTGVTHSDDLMYVFSIPPSKQTPLEAKTTQRMTKMLTNFAIYGDPTPEEDEEALEKLGIPKWYPNSCDNHQYLLIQNDLTVEKDFTDRWTIMMDELRSAAIKEIGDIRRVS